MSIEQQFRSFHNENPHVLSTLERIAGEWFEQGNGPLGIGMLWEVMRWQIRTETKGDPFRLNNNYRSRYVRMMIDRHPEWEPMFETRILRAA